MIRLLTVICLLGLLPAWADVSVSPAMAQRIGRKLWQNESDGSVSGLTAWNSKEQFASLGIGHFIWYPAGGQRTFQESFPSMISFMQSQGVRVPGWMRGPCPWPNREAFRRDADSPRMRELRSLLAGTVKEQTYFAVDRSQRALPRILSSVPAADKNRVSANYHAVAVVPNGVYGLIDYVNFKGEGTNPSERYKGQGWGLAQVLQEMRSVSPGPSAAREFAAAAKRVLARRVRNAPRNETSWLKGWSNRCDSYAQAW